MGKCCPYCVDSEGFQVQLEGDGYCPSCGYRDEEVEG